MGPYEWDDVKNAENLSKHRVDFELVEQFEWDTAVFQLDVRFDYGEERIRAFGRIAGRPFCVVYTMRGVKVRIISLRSMHEKEARRYAI